MDYFVPSLSDFRDAHVCGETKQIYFNGYSSCGLVATERYLEVH